MSELHSNCEFECLNCILFVANSLLQQLKANFADSWQSWQSAWGFLINAAGGDRHGRTWQQGGSREQEGSKKQAAGNREIGAARDLASSKQGAGLEQGAGREQARSSRSAALAFLLYFRCATSIASQFANVRGRN